MSEAKNIFIFFVFEKVQFMFYKNMTSETNQLVH